MDHVYSNLCCRDITSLNLSDYLVKYFTNEETETTQSSCGLKFPRLENGRDEHQNKIPVTPEFCSS